MSDRNSFLPNMDDPILKPMVYGNRLRKYVLISSYLDTLSIKGNLKEALFKIQMISFENIVKDFEVNKLFRPDLDLKLKETALKKLRDNAEQDAKKDIEDYLPILFNQILVTICTVLDTFLSDSLKVITTLRPHVLKSLATNDDIKISDLIDSRDYNEIFSKVQKAFLDKYDFKSINDRISFLRNKLGVDVDQALRLKSHNEEIQTSYPIGLQFLLDVYEKRNDVVHRDLRPLKTYVELSNISTYIEYSMMDLGIVLGKHFRIPVDFEEFIKKMPKGLNPQKLHGTE